jgi:leucyl-tRNA synthetase
MGGAEHTVLHLMYARFFTKALQKHGVISFGEPFLKLRHQGTILAEDGSKMSKSKGNVINPDDVVELYGADTIRLYEMFMGPLETMKPWNTKSIIGPRRFLDRVWRLLDNVQHSGESIDAVLHQTVQKVTVDTPGFGLNTAIAQMMICLNAFESKHSVLQSEFETFLKVLAPYAPHITEELWDKLGHTTSIHLETWPTYDPKKLLSDMATIAIQIAGKTRGAVTVPRGATETQVLEAARNDEKTAKYMPQTHSKVIFVENRVLNIIP